eukprot:453886-Hanusia_phi.AAC.8
MSVTQVRWIGAADLYKVCVLMAIKVDGILQCDEDEIDNSAILSLHSCVCKDNALNAKTIEKFEREACSLDIEMGFSNVRQTLYPASLT